MYVYIVMKWPALTIRQSYGWLCDRWQSVNHENSRSRFSLKIVSQWANASVTRKDLNIGPGETASSAHFRWATFCLTRYLSHWGENSMSHLFHCEIFPEGNHKTIIKWMVLFSDHVSDFILLLMWTDHFLFTFFSLSNLHNVENLLHNPSLSLYIIYIYIQISLNTLAIFCLHIFFWIYSYYHIAFIVFGRNWFMYCPQLYISLVLSARLWAIIRGGSITNVM